MRVGPTLIGVHLFLAVFAAAQGPPPHAGDLRKRVQDWMGARSRTFSSCRGCNGLGQRVVVVDPLRGRKQVPCGGCQATGAALAKSSWERALDAYPDGTTADLMSVAELDGEWKSAGSPQNLARVKARIRWPKKEARADRPRFEEHAGGGLYFAHVAHKTIDEESTWGYLPPRKAGMKWTWYCLGPGDRALVDRAVRGVVEELREARSRLPGGVDAVAKQLKGLAAKNLALSGMLAARDLEGAIAIARVDARASGSSPEADDPKELARAYREIATDARYEGTLARREALARAEIQERRMEVLARAAQDAAHLAGVAEVEWWIAERRLVVLLRRDRRAAVLEPVVRLGELVRSRRATAEAREAELGESILSATALPERAPLRLERAWLRLRLGRAAASIEGVSGLETQETAALHGLALLELDQQDEALRFLDRALDGDGLVPARGSEVRLARAQRRLRIFVDERSAASERARALAEDDVAAAAERDLIGAKLRIVIADLDAAMGAASRPLVAEARATRGLASLARAVFAEERRSLDLALEDGKAALGVDPTSPRAHGLLFEAFRRRTPPDQKAASFHLRRQLELDPDLPRPSFAEPTKVASVADALGEAGLIALLAWGAGWPVARDYWMLTRDFEPGPAALGSLTWHSLYRSRGR